MKLRKYLSYFALITASLLLCIALTVGAPVSILLDRAKSAGRIKGSSELEVHAVSIEHHGRISTIETNVDEEEGKDRGKQTAVRSGVGGRLGLLLERWRGVVKAPASAHWQAAALGLDIS